MINVMLDAINSECAAFGKREILWKVTEVKLVAKGWVRITDLHYAEFFLFIFYFCA
jgi:hypothetical protein